MVPEGHGEFTHRLQWYIICSERERNLGGSDKYKVENDPVVLMFATAVGQYKLDEAMVKDDRWMWDLLCDSFYANNSLPSEFGNATTYRSPEFMMSTFKPMVGGSTDLLTLFIRYRLDKRTAMGLNRPDGDGVKAGKAYLDSKLAKWNISKADYEKYAGNVGSSTGRVIFNQRS
jgi:hypothetical protein